MDRKQQIITLMNSCAEGYSGEWDPTGEGRDGFSAMYDELAALAKDLGLDVSEAKTMADPSF